MVHKKSITSMLVHRQVPIFPEGLPKYINRPDANRRPLIVSTEQYPQDIEDKTALQAARQCSGAASIAQSRHAVMDAIKAGARTKKDIQAKSGLSKASVHNHCKSMAADGILMFDKSVSPWVVEMTR